VLSVFHFLSVSIRPIRVIRVLFFTSVHPSNPFIRVLIFICVHPSNPFNPGSDFFISIINSFDDFANNRSACWMVLKRLPFLSREVLLPLLPEEIRQDCHKFSSSDPKLSSRLSNLCNFLYCIPIFTPNHSITKSSFIVLFPKNRFCLNQFGEPFRHFLNFRHLLLLSFLLL
jgi:hypothetical protein